MPEPTLVFRQIESFLLQRTYHEGDSEDIEVSVVLTVDHTQQRISITPEGILEDITQPSKLPKTKTSFTLLGLKRTPAYWIALAKLIEHATTEGHARLSDVNRLPGKPLKELY